MIEIETRSAPCSIISCARENSDVWTSRPGKASCSSLFAMRTKMATAEAWEYTFGVSR
jgi:hypothetical protein